MYIKYLRKTYESRYVSNFDPDFRDKNFRRNDEDRAFYFYPEKGIETGVRLEQATLWSSVALYLSMPITNSITFLLLLET